VSLLYDAGAGGMWAYRRAAFRVTTLGPRRFRLAPGTLLLVAHRAETDVPVVCPSLYARAGLWRRRSPLERMTFAARDDMFLVGFLAGFPAGLPPQLRARLFSFGVGRWLPSVQVHPLRSATTARLGEALRARPQEHLEGLLGPDERRAFAARAAALHLPQPLRVADALRGEYADLLWRPIGRDHPATAGLDGFWSGRAARAAADFRFFVGLLRAGGVLVVFPEGRPSPDGTLGPIARGLAALARRGRPAVLRPLALAYDPLVHGRTRVTISIGRPVPRPDAGVEAVALSLLRRELPLTAGQIVAAGADPVSAVDDAVASGRPVEPELLAPHRRERRLDEARAVAERRPGLLPFLAREYASARER
jgi:hypothetical protein